MGLLWHLLTINIHALTNIQNITYSFRQRLPINGISSGLIHWSRQDFLKSNAVCCSRCYQMDDYSPAKNLMTMCFTYYYIGTVHLSLSPLYIHSFHCQCLVRMLTDSALLSLTSTQTMLSLCGLVWQYCIRFCKLEELSDYCTTATHVCTKLCCYLYILSFWWFCFYTQRKQKQKLRYKVYISKGLWTEGSTWLVILVYSSWSSFITFVPYILID